MSRSSELIERLEPMWEMANLSTKRTGLPVFIFVSAKSGKHGPRIKVGKTRSSFRDRKQNFSVTISDTPEVISGNISGIVDLKTLNLIFEWIVLNKNVLLNYWNDQLDTEDMIDQIRSI